MEQYSCVHLFIVLLMNTTLMTITLQTIPRCACVRLCMLAGGGDVVVLRQSLYIVLAVLKLTSRLD